MAMLLRRGTSGIVGGGGRGRHFGMVIGSVVGVVLVVGASAASSLGPRGIGAPCRGRWTVSAGASPGGVVSGGG